jgi:restriction system protein
LRWNGAPISGAAAEFFTSLGLTAEVDATVTGSRATHDGDVLVRFATFGVNHMWVIECKSWRRRVPKERLLILRGVVEDVGADRGFLIS